MMNKNKKTYRYLVPFYALCLYLKPYLSLIPFHESEWRRRHRKSEEAMATSSPTRFVIFPAILFLIVLIPLYLSPINRNQSILLHLLPTHSNLSETTHQTLQTSSSPSLWPKNDSADGVPSTSSDGARTTNEIRKRLRVRDNLPLQH